MNNKPQKPRSGGPANNKPTQPIFGGNMWWLWLVVFGLLIYMSTRGAQPSSKIVSAAQLENAIQQGLVQEVVFEPETLKIYGKLKPVDASKKEKAETFVIRAISSEHLNEVRKLAEKSGVKYSVTEPPSNFLSNLIWIILPIGILIYFFIGMRKGGMGGLGGGGSFTKSPGKQVRQDALNRKTFDDVAGCDEAKEELREVVEFLKNPERFSELGARIPKGVMLYGPPGTGKTLLARAVAGEADVPFISVSGSGFVEMFVGVGAARVRSLFDEAKKCAPCIIFIDEIEALGKQRGFAIGGGHDEREQALNELLQQMSGFEGENRVIVMAATNRPELVDSALTRPGRFDRHVNVALPGWEGREAILKIHGRDKKLDAKVNLKDVAKDTVGMSGADLENVMNEAALLAARCGKKAIEQADISEAIDRASMGPEKKTTKLSEKERKTIAYHEAGHALTAILMPDADPVHRITIIPRGPALGYVKQLPIEDRHLVSRKQLLAQVAVCLGGRATEELVLGDISSVASNDLEKASLIMRKMIYELGMNDKAGLAVYKGSFDFWGQSTGVDASDKTKELLEQEVKDTLEKIYADVKKLLQKNQEKLEALVRGLLEKETLNAEEVKQIIG